MAAFAFDLAPSVYLNSRAEYFCLLGEVLLPVQRTDLVSPEISESLRLSKGLALLRRKYKPGACHRV